MKEATQEAMLDHYRGWPTFEGLTVVKACGGYKYYQCPFGCAHYAYINVGAGGDFHSVLYCAHCDKHGWLNIPDLVASVLESEERRFRKLLGEFDGITELSPGDAVVYWHSKGMPLEIVEEVCTDMVEFHRLANEHRAKSGNRFKAAYE